MPFASISHLALLLIAWASSSTRYCHFMRWKYLTSCTIWTGHNNPLAIYITKLNERHEMLIVMRHLCTALSTRRYLNALCNTSQGGLWPDCLKQFRSPDHNTRSYTTPCKKCASSLTRPATQYREEAGHEKYSLLSLTRMSNQLQIS